MSANPWAAPESENILPEPRPARHFTLLEFVVALGIIGLLIALLIPASRSAKGAARRAQCVNNLKQIGLALHNYEQAYGALPPAYTVDAAGRPLHSWRTLILPFIEERPLYQSIDLAKPWNHPANARALQRVPYVYRCPERAKPGNTSTYLAAVGRDACFRPGVPRPLAEITDDHGATLMVIEASDENAVPWMAPYDAGEALVSALGSATKSPHTGGMNACFVDGSVKFLKTNLSPALRRALMTVSGHDDPSADSY